MNDHGWLCLANKSWVHSGASHSRMSFWLPTFIFYFCFSTCNRCSSVWITEKRHSLHEKSHFWKPEIAVKTLANETLLTIYFPVNCIKWKGNHTRNNLKYSETGQWASLVLHNTASLWGWYISTCIALSCNACVMRRNYSLAKIKDSWQM